MQLNNTEKAVLREFIERLSDYMGDSGCNDYQLPDTEEGWQLACEHAKALNKDRDDNDPQEKPQLICYDWVLLSILAKKLGL